MSDESVSSSRRPIASLEDYRERNNKRAKEYYYKNHDTLKTKLRERAQAKRDQTQDGIKTVLEVVGEISLALVKIQDVLKALDKTQRASTPIAS
jgi:hypothetical protein